MQYLRLSLTEISDIDFISNLTNLNELVLNENKIINIKSLENLENMVYLDLSYNQIENLLL
jgi:Leucine-rich repeat (LRR) protein